MLDLSLYEGNLRSLLLLGTGRNGPGCWRDKGNNSAGEGPRGCVAQDPSAYHREPVKYGTWEFALG